MSYWLPKSLIKSLFTVAFMILKKLCFVSWICEPVLRLPSVSANIGTTTWLLWLQLPVSVFHLSASGLFTRGCCCLYCGVFLCLRFTSHWIAIFSSFSPSAHEIHFQKEFFEGNLPFIPPDIIISWVRSVGTNTCNW